MKMVLSWGQLIYVFFPIPVFCLALLSLAWPRSLERAGSRIVSKIFFTEVRAGPVHIKLLYLFIALSVAIFAGTVRTLHAGAKPCKTCVYAGETLWYGKAMKFRAERNFWLSLFNVILWMLVWTVHRDRKKILSLKDRVLELESAAKAEGSGAKDETTEADTAEDAADAAEKSDESKKED